MSEYGAKNFQIKRENIIIKYVKEAGDFLLTEEVSISARTISETVISLLKKNNIEKKYYVEEQTIGRNKKYKTIWQSDQKKQQLLPRKISTKKNMELDEFEVRDKLDMLQQDYFTLLDKYRFHKNEKSNLEKENKSLLAIAKQNNQNNNILDIGKTILSQEVNIVKLINNILDNGSVVIVKKEEEDEIIIKNINNSNQERAIISISEWEKFCG